MIFRRRKKERRKVPPNVDLPASDFILHRENRNPYRHGTPESRDYDRHYSEVLKILTTARHLEQELSTDPTGDTRGQL